MRGVELARGSTPIITYCIALAKMLGFSYQSNKDALPLRKRDYQRCYNQWYMLLGRTPEMTPTFPSVSAEMLLRYEIMIEEVRLP